MASLACEFSATTANIQDAWTAFDQDGEELTDVFGQEDVFYCIVQLANAPEDTTVKATWIAVNVEGVEPNHVIQETDITTDSGQLYFELSNDQLWPTGNYKVEIYLNGELDRTLEFQVR
jgi:hypothetical protein